MRSYQAEPGAGVPPEMMVEIATDGKTFHVPGCKYLHKNEIGGKSVHLLTAAEAIREGYTPCVRCLRRYLNRQAELVMLQNLGQDAAILSPGGEGQPTGSAEGD